MNKRIVEKRVSALVVGSGAAGLNAVDELKKKGYDVLLVTDSLKGGTSLNSGSDKQTYYKLSLSGDYPDSVDKMAAKFFSGGGMQGYHARSLAAMSAQSFMKLALLGVPFPQNEYGEYVGYQTDHDESARATSAGPLTSRMMGECLLKSVRARNAEVIEGAELVSIYTKEGTAYSALFEKDDCYLKVDFGAMLLCTGGCSRIYYNRVFSDLQNGATGAALRTGVWANNLCYWQYGLASVDVKWNVSGSYQQAIPEYTDENGQPIENDMPEREDLIFLKGYQWPFDASRGDKSGKIDSMVKRVYDNGGAAYLDYRKDPLNGDLSHLGKEAYTYLKNCDALKGGAYDRLAAINKSAIEFYLNNGIDLAKEPLKIALCAQHSNGGLYVDRNWQTNIKNLYAAGECAGVFGAYRPGGSALNETQVGSLTAVRNIVKNGARPINVPIDVFSDDIRFNENGIDDGEAVIWQKRMDACAGAVRNVSEMKKMLNDIKRRLEELDGGAYLRDILTVQKYALSAMIEQSYYKGHAGHVHDNTENNGLEHSGYAFVTDHKGTHVQDVTPVEKGEQWFEKVWKRDLAERK